MSFKNLVHKIGESQVFVGMVTDNFLKNEECAMQIAVAIILDKPIFFAVQHGAVLPEKLKRIADKIEYINLEDQEGLSKALKNFIDTHEGKNEQI